MTVGLTVLPTVMPTIHLATLRLPLAYHRRDDLACATVIGSIERRPPSSVTSRQTPSWYMGCGVDGFDGPGTSLRTVTAGFPRKPVEPRSIITNVLPPDRGESLCISLWTDRASVRLPPRCNVMLKFRAAEDFLIADHNICGMAA